MNAMRFSERQIMSDKLIDEKTELPQNAAYSKKAVELHANKVNVGVIENADVTLAYTGPCGDTCKIYLKINGQTIIEHAKFQYLGCPASAACGSSVTQIATGMSLRDAERITEEEVIAELGGLPEDEYPYVTLVLTTLWKAIKKYRNNKK